MKSIRLLIADDHPVARIAAANLVATLGLMVVASIHPRRRARFVLTGSAIDVAITVDRCRAVRDIVGTTEAGGGCTACHRRIRDILARRV